MRCPTCGEDVSLEPLLGDRQTALVAALTRRLGSTTPMSEPDVRVAAWLANVLRIGDGRVALPAEAPR